MYRPNPLAPFSLPSARAGALLLLTLLLGSCGTKDNVSLRQQINFQEAATQDPKPLVSGAQAIAQTLARGGYIIYLRHGRTQYDQIEMERNNRLAGKFDLAQCDTQRQLSDAGRAELKVAGGQFRLTGVPLEKSYSSRYCRATESAGFFVDGAQATNNLSGEGDVGKDPAQKARTIAFLTQRPAPGKNIFMMAHGGIFWEATGFSIEEANAVVLDPNNLKVIVARIGPYEWGAVAQARP